MRNRGSGQVALRLDVAVCRRVWRRFSGELALHEQLINDLNVFPVPDGDTGTNSLLTVRSGLASLDKSKAKLPLNQLLAAFVDQVTLGARGNSGVILAEYFRGLSQVSAPALDSQLWHQALVLGAVQARQAVSQPREGTMLTVADEVAAIPVDGDFSKYVARIATVSRRALLATTDQLPELKAAGVVDSGALVLTLFHECVSSEVNGTPMPELEIEQRKCDLTSIEYRGPAFEVMFNFDGDISSRDSLREELTVMGDSITVTGRHSPFKVHVHVDEPGEVVAEAMRHGRVTGLAITQLIVSDAIDTSGDVLAVVFASDALGLRNMVESLSAKFMPTLPNAAPSTSDFIRAIRDSGAGKVALVISNADSQASATLAAYQMQADNVVVRVVCAPSSAVVLSALAVLNQVADLEQVCTDLNRQIASTTWASVARAQRSTMTQAGMCHQGDVVGLIRDLPIDVSSVATPEDMLSAVVHTLLDNGGELVTVVVGDQGHDWAVEILRADFPGVEFEVFFGGQLSTIYLVGVE